MQNFEKIKSKKPQKKADYTRRNRNKYRAIKQGNFNKEKDNE